MDTDEPEEENETLRGEVADLKKARFGPFTGTGKDLGYYERDADTQAKEGDI